jgi:hypothetical protein
MDQRPFTDNLRTYLVSSEVEAVFAESAERLASRLLAQSGVTAIWDTHIAAAAAYGLGNREIAASLVEIAEAAERLWLSRALTPNPHQLEPKIRLRQKLTTRQIGRRCPSIDPTSTATP